MQALKKKADILLEDSGIKINGSNPWDIKVKNDKAYEETFKKGSLGFGESFMRGWVEIDDLEEFFVKVFNAKLDEKVNKMDMMSFFVKSFIKDFIKKEDPYEVGKVHYDIGNDLYSKMLDKRMVYSCGYWDGCMEFPPAKTLDEAQERKLEMICRKLGLKKGDRVLDIGSGWGGLLIYAAEKYGIEGVGISVSKEQIKLANEKKGNLPLEFRIQDYRDLNEKFDYIISIGMFEHVGYKHYRDYFKAVSKNLKDDGLLLLHTIGSNVSKTGCDPWVNKYIFPNSMLPSLSQISKDSEDILLIEDIHNISYNYYPTLKAWYNNFQKAWPGLKDKYSETFYRMWNFYLLSSAALFKCRMNQVWQIIFSKEGVKQGYKRPC